ncbi:BNR repeat-containing protein [Micromonospora sp. PLK6-60]|uniref:BNR repeat-containing protein n=1 Tax=Micromonospora sp. PLK6-60 TaxID=2873383 RepID=UPI001CA5F5BB|nr:BNR repeat-containing protein [Micromonospora sp. PLK6-60]MBY8875929.1 BNR repeat-containing protein [Micromonospora sp. PLK6-60]
MSSVPSAPVRPPRAGRVRMLAVAMAALLAGAGPAPATAAPGSETPTGATATAGTVSFSDDFQRANGPVGNGWVAARGTWSIAAGAVQATGPAERVLVRESLFLGASHDIATSLVLPAPAGSARLWAGIAFQVVDHADGTQTFYALRVGQNQGDGARARWQLVRIDHSVGATDTGLLGEGDLAAAPGTALGLRVTATPDGAGVVVRVSAGATVLDRTVPLRLVDRLSGGKVGLYSQAGAVGLRDFAVTATTAPGYRSFFDGFDRADGAVGNGWRAARGTWRIAAGAAVPSGTDERLMYPSGLNLGDTFLLKTSLTLPTPALTYRSWSGLAFNVVDHADGTQSYYVLRIGQSQADGGRAQWQVVRMTRSSSGAPDALLAGGSVSAAPGDTLSLGIDSKNRGTGIHVAIDGAGVPAGRAVDQYVGLRWRDLLTGGGAGVYSQAGAVGFPSFAVETSNLPAGAPAEPGPLDCSPRAPGDYPLPGTSRSVSQVVDVGTTWAGHPVEQAILTSGTDQYVAYYDADRRMTVAKRSLTDTTWTRRTLDSTLGWDSHNSITMALDSTGNLHLAGNMHAVPLVYFRTSVPGDLGTLTRIPTMVDSALEGSVTYPRFLRHTNGDLLFSYRNGVSGDGANYYNRYDPASRTWSSLLNRPLVDGGGRNAYPDGPVRGPDGYWHMVLVWRDTPDAGSSSMPSYARSRDLVSWEDSAGRPLALPLTYLRSEVIDPVPTYGGVVNGNARLGFDSANRVVVTYTKYDADLGNQLYAAQPDGSGGWRITQLSNWTGRWEVLGGGTLTFPVGLPAAASGLPDGRLRVPYTCGGAKRSLIVEPSSMSVVADVPEPALPSEITQVRSGFAGIGVRTASSVAGDRTYVLRWESMPANQDLPRPPEQTPPAQPLQLYVLTTP